MRVHQRATRPILAARYARRSSNSGLIQGCYAANELTWALCDKSLSLQLGHGPLGATEINLVRDGATLRWVSASRAPRFCRRLAVSWLFRPTRRGGGANV